MSQDAKCVSSISNKTNYKSVLCRDHEIMVPANSWTQLQCGLVQRFLINMFYSFCIFHLQHITIYSTGKYVNTFHHLHPTIIPSDVHMCMNAKGSLFDTGIGL